jgi:hypothetical protein
MFDLSFGEFCGVWLIMLVFAVIGIRKMARSFDSDGAVKDAAKKGVISVIGRLLK